MKRKLNCWEFRNCGREKGGLLAEHLGICPVTLAMKYDGTHDGQAAGRICWSLHDSVCRTEPVDSGRTPCHLCEFYRRVVHEEAENTECRFASVAL